MMTRIKVVCLSFPLNLINMFLSVINPELASRNGALAIGPTPPVAPAAGGKYTSPYSQKKG